MVNFHIYKTKSLLLSKSQFIFLHWKLLHIFAIYNNLLQKYNSDCHMSNEIIHIVSPAVIMMNFNLTALYFHKGIVSIYKGLFNRGTDPRVR